MTDDLSRDDDSDANLTEPTHCLNCEIDNTEQPSVAVVRAVAELTGEDIRDLNPLYNVIDPNHLDGVFKKNDSTGSSRAEVSLRFNGCTVIVTPKKVTVRLSE